MNIGLLMVSGEDDILAETLGLNVAHVDIFYALDNPTEHSEAICKSFPKCAGYITDADLPRPPYPTWHTAGYRKAIHEMAVAEHGAEHWFLLLHGDEVWTFDPATVVAAYPDADGFMFDLPAYIPREEWDDGRGPLEQLKWWIGPGWSEFRMFHGASGVSYDENQHFSTTPAGLRNIVTTSERIKHYPWRSPASQRLRASASGFGAGNYQHVSDHGAVIWTDRMIEEYQDGGYYRELGCDP